MNDEIKEILAYFEEYVKITDMHDSEPMLNWKDLKIVLDYITNLQQKYNENVSKYEELLEKYFNTKQRIDKASEYILDHHPDNSIIPQGFCLEVLKILKGDSE